MATVFYTAVRTMTDVTRILSAIDQGDSHAADKLLPLVYDELRKLAARKLSNERPGETLQATGLVHEAYLRLVGSPSEQKWNGAGTSSPPQPRGCGASSWSAHAKNVVQSAAAIGRE